jgi:ribosomal-protein-alanine N-acetyltransferase
MLTPPPPLRLRPMTPDDIPAVLAVDRLSFPTPSKEALFVRELTDNPLAHYHVLSAAGPGGDEQLIGFSGYWFIADEIHVNTIAVHPSLRGRRLGELLFANLLLDAATLEPVLYTLEVRTSNAPAQALYRRYRFEEVGRRRRYYHDTGEDALLMSVVPAEQPGYAAWVAAQAGRLLAALASAALPPGLCITF